MKIHNHTFIHTCKTGTILKITVIRDGINTPKFDIANGGMSDLNDFERIEYMQFIAYISATLMDEYTDDEVRAMAIRHNELI